MEVQVGSRSVTTLACRFVIVKKQGMLIASGAEISCLTRRRLSDFLLRHECKQTVGTRAM